MQQNGHRERTARRRILVVDDNHRLLDSLSEVLEKEGFLPEPTDDVASARALYRRERPDLVVLDCDIRGQDGLELLDDLRAEPPVSPVIVMTARDDRATRLRVRHLGAESMVNKPFRVKELIAEIQRILLVHAALAPDALAQPLRLLAYHLPKLLGPQDPREFFRRLRENGGDNS